MTIDRSLSKHAALARIESSAPALLALHHDLAEHPETAWQEHRASGLVADAIESQGFAVVRGAGGIDTALHATAGTGPVHIAFIAEYDALPGLGHACGHNLIAAAAVGAAIAIAPAADELGVTVHLIGTPAEEGGGGKILMLEAGEFAGLDAALMFHPGPANSLRAEPFAVAHLQVRFRGIGAHAAAYPELGVNAADAFTVAQVAIGLLRQQLTADVRVHGIVQEAGTAANAIPDRSVGYWYVRSTSLAGLEALMPRVIACFEAGALATGCALEIAETSPRYAEFRHDSELEALVDANAAKLGIVWSSSGPDGMNTASTDMGNVSQVVPSVHPYLSIDSLPAVNHQAAFAAAAQTARADEVALLAATLLAWTAVDVALRD